MDQCHIVQWDHLLRPEGVKAHFQGSHDAHRSPGCLHCFCITSNPPALLFSPTLVRDIMFPSLPASSTSRHPHLAKHMWVITEHAKQTRHKKEKWRQSLQHPAASPASNSTQLDFKVLSAAVQKHRP